LSTIIPTVHRMREGGLAEAATSGQNGRVTVVSVTALGDAAIERAELAPRHIFKCRFQA
jgi:DNA-binding MarR family transcriptional regulator